MNNIKDGWFHEFNEKMWPGEAHSLQIEKVLYSEKSKFQDILVFKSKTYGNVLVLDGVIQITERDEFSYQEMIANLPLFSHKDPKNVLVIGGGDGGVVREVARHTSVQKITLCEIDKMVVDTARKFFPEISSTLVNDKRVTVVYEDGATFLQKHENEFDVIIVDSSDPVGPAESLFGEKFYKSALNALTKDGIICSQAESFWLHLDLIKEMYDFVKPLFKNVEYAYTLVPTYPSGLIGFYLCRKGEGSCSKPVREIPKELAEQLKYYNSEIHSGAFMLPSFARRKIFGK